MVDAQVNVSGYDASYGVDAYNLSDQYRQILVVGSPITSSLGGVAAVESSALYVSSITNDRSVLGLVGVSSLSAGHFTGLVGVSSLSAGHFTGLVGVSSLSSTVNTTTVSSTHGVSSTGFNGSGAGGSPVNVVLIPAPGADKAILVHGAQMFIVGNGATATGQIVLYHGTDDDDDSKVLLRARGVGVNAQSFNLISTAPIKCGTNQPIKFFFSEDGGAIYGGGTVYHETIDV